MQMRSNAQALPDVTHSFLGEVAASPVHRRLTEGIGQLVIETFRDERGNVAINLRQLAAALIDSLGTALAAMDEAENAQTRYDLAMVVAVDVALCARAMHISEKNSQTLDFLQRSSKT